MDKKNIVCTSSILGEDMHVVAYGKKGLPVVVFPTQGQAPESLEEVGVIDELADYLDSGTIQLFCTETVDDESWGGTGDPAERAQRQETYYHYVVDELVPLVAKMNKSGARPLALGFDAGATQASVVALRRPDLFQGCVCLSGCYDARRYFGDWMDATLYDNTPCAFLSQMPVDHPYVAVYNQRQLLFCTGQEASEADSLRSTHEMGEQFARLGVDVWCDYWGADVTHTWFWWKKQLRYFLPIVLDDVEKTTAAEKPAPAKKRATTRKKAATTTAAKKPAAKKAAPAKAAAEKVEEPAKATAKKPAAAKATTTKAAAAKPAAAKTTAAKKAATTKAATAKKEVAEKPAVTKKAAAPAKAEKPATPAKATKAAVPAKATKAAAPAKAVKPAAPAKAEKPAAPAKAVKAATPAKATKAAAPAKAPAAKKAAAPKAAAEKKPAATKTAAKSAATKAKSAK
ncbi:alpha/beta hydrolase-fold protein [Olsenella sp. An270]|uniref:alpha/beta hydrolase-fold protein n=1 Tax=Olsenella sp. An270 TaxID=1965615 RepID=UPI001950240E|nr:alpha/beta hydrolase-fold protein [Olsenella sp. An270]